MKKLFSAAAALAFIATPASAEEMPRYTFDTVHTQIIFYASHLGFSKSEGEFLEFDGEFHFDPENWADSSVELTIDATSVDMDNEKWDDHMKNEDFFHVEKHPNITFKSTKVESADGKTGQVHGDLTILGITKPVTLDVTFNRIGVHPYSRQTVAGFSATTEIKRSEWGMKYGIPAVGNNVELRIEVEGERQFKGGPKR